MSQRELKRQRQRKSTSSWATGDETLVDSERAHVNDESEMVSRAYAEDEDNFDRPSALAWRNVDDGDRARSSGKRRALARSSSFMSSSSPVKSPSQPVVRCKFARAGCPFYGSPEQVKHHEVSYCGPLYTRLAEYKMRADASTSTGESRSERTSGSMRGVDDGSGHHRTRISSNDAGYHLGGVQVALGEGQERLRSTSSGSGFAGVISPTSPSHPLSYLTSPPRYPTSLPPELSDSARNSQAELRSQISRLSSDLSRLQSQLESEKRLRTDRLRRASERVMELMASASLGEGKVEVLKAQLSAERELREKLEEELDALRAGAGAEAAGYAVDNGRQQDPALSLSGQAGTDYRSRHPLAGETMLHSAHYLGSGSASSSSLARRSHLQHQQSGRQRVHRREKASDGMSSSPVEAEFQLATPASGAGQMSRSRSPLKGVLKRQREDSSAPDAFAGQRSQTTMHS